MKKVRVRIAPSPTGPLHVGTARTALFNWLFAKHHQGIFVLRIEDTDRARSEMRFERDILDQLTWLGLIWDEGPYRQSERVGVYQHYIKRLVKEKLAFYCDCAKTELAAARAAARAAGRPYVYSGRCRNQSEAKNQAAVIRLRSRPGEIVFKDLIRGPVAFQESAIGDIVIAKSDAEPLYNLAVVIDDHEMKITHVIRGEDHIANTPKQIMIQRALGMKPPAYAHLPLLLNEDRSKMSKRKQSAHVADFRNAGYLPEAFFNFIALLGWHPKDDQEIISVNELIKLFRIKDVQKGGAVFDPQKLEWMNDQYFKKISLEEIIERLAISDNERNRKIIAYLRERKSGSFTKSDFETTLAFTENDPDYDPAILIWRKSTGAEARQVLRMMSDQFKNWPKDEAFLPFEKSLAPLISAYSRGAVLWPLRVALSGAATSPSADELAEILELPVIIRRVNKARRALEEFDETIKSN